MSRIVIDAAERFANTGLEARIRDAACILGVDPERAVKEWARRVLVHAADHLREKALTAAYVSADYSLRSDKVDRVICERIVALLEARHVVLLAMEPFL
jgi:hypothetical protein